jgi:stage V sporulation protein SpoVS
MGTTANVLVGDVTVTLARIAAEDPGGLQTAGLLPITGFYTMDGVNLNIRSSFADIKVEENVGTVIRKLTDQEVSVTMNIAEGSLKNLVAAVAGSSINVGGTIVTIGGGALQGFQMTLVGTAPSAGVRTIVLTRVQPTGEVGIPYKKGEVSIIPVTFSCIVADTGIFGTITDS